MGGTDIVWKVQAKCKQTVHFSAVHLKSVRTTGARRNLTTWLQKVTLHSERTEQAFTAYSTEWEAAWFHRLKFSPGLMESLSVFCSTSPLHWRVKASIRG